MGEAIYSDGLGKRFSRYLARSIATKVAMFTPAAPIVSFTFDDFTETAATGGSAILEDNGARGTFYVSGGMVGLDRSGGRNASARQCIVLDQRGHEIGCHSFSHKPVASQSWRALEADLVRNQDFFREHDAAFKFKNFAFPYNATSLLAKRRLERHFLTCRGGVPGINVGRVDLGFLRAVELCDDVIDGDQARKWIEDAVRLQGWLIFFTHGVTEDHTPWRCTPGLLEATIKSAQALGCELLTIDAAAARVGLPQTLDG